MTKYFIFAGEMSGDLHGSRLIRALRDSTNLTSIAGVGGPRMRQEGMQCMNQMEEFQVMGFSDVLIALPKLCKLFFRVKNFILKTNPDCVILIDYPGFNLRLAKALRKSGFSGKLVQYICPTVWAHGKNRIQILESNYDLLLTIFPFESTFFTSSKLKVEYVGNPLLETIQTHAYQDNWKTQIGLPGNSEVIALFPGSRLGEVQKNTPLQLQVAAALKLKHPELLFALSCAQENLKPDLLNFVSKSPLKLNQDLFIVPPYFHYDLMKDCKTALAKSGTVTLELALHRVPTLVHYELSFLNNFFAKCVLQLQLPHYCIVNILSGHSLFPECIGRNVTMNELVHQIEAIHFDSSRYLKIQKECDALIQHLGNRPSHHYAAHAIQDLMKC